MCLVGVDALPLGRRLVDTLGLHPLGADTRQMRRLEPGMVEHRLLLTCLADTLVLWLQVHWQEEELRCNLLEPAGKLPAELARLIVPMAREDGQAAGQILGLELQARGTEFRFHQWVMAGTPTETQAAGSPLAMIRA